MTIIIPIIAAMIAMAALIVSPMNSRFDSIDSRFAQIDQRFAQIDQRFAQIDQRFAQIDQRFAQIDEKFARLEAKIDANTQRIVEIESKLDRIADMTILAHGNGEITSDELALIWETAGENDSNPSIIVVAAGDLRALHNHERRAIRLHLTGDRSVGPEKLLTAIEVMELRRE